MHKAVSPRLPLFLVSLFPLTFRRLPSLRPRARPDSDPFWPRPLEPALERGPLPNLPGRRMDWSRMIFVRDAHHHGCASCVLTPCCAVWTLPYWAGAALFTGCSAS